MNLAEFADRVFDKPADLLVGLAFREHGRGMTVLMALWRRVVR